ncbi:(2Fe-2S) ferredoxin domain-containing protein [Limnofasciculus baicalensis]|uniref:Ferredoxin n=1 Tax=Limnofasciculus baicalensis BBK-W-15 TaxID=2699891 RepID=A0AAE3KQY6_9CYAN|nr:ferredoxin [Limnofasciculus baicalensis]MCP2731098.1 ferredoxin [Limnofasciculus baicalensis BBK-W-15]
MEANETNHQLVEGSHPKSSKANESGDNYTITATIKNLGINQIQRHVFICADQTKPICCLKEAGIEAWSYLKKRLKELKLDLPTTDRASCIFRTKANCLRICANGPIMVVYPDGVWYCRVTPDAIERIIRQHLIGNKVVEEYAFLIHPLPEMIEAAIPESEMARQVDSQDDKQSDY